MLDCEHLGQQSLLVACAAGEAEAGAFELLSVSEPSL